MTVSTDFFYPGGVAIDRQGNIFVADTGNNAIKEILAPNGTAPAVPTVVTLASGFNGPFGVAVDGNGNVFVADTFNNAVKMIQAVNGTIPASPTITNLGSGFKHPGGVAVDSSGNVYVADGNNRAVKEILAVNGAIPASPTIRNLGSGFLFPDGLAVDSAGDVFVADAESNLVQEIIAVNGIIPETPEIITLGSGFSQPYGLAVDNSGNLYVADFGNNTVRELLAVNGSIPASPVMKSVGLGLQQAEGVAVSASGKVFIADGDNDRVVKFSSDAWDFGLISIGSSSSPISVNFSFDTAGTLGSTAVLTQGNLRLDFSDAGTGTCLANSVYASGQTCTVDVAFNPKYAGSRSGATVLQDSSGSVIATSYLSGAGSGPQVDFLGETVTSALINNVNNLIPTALVVDGAGNLYVASSELNQVWKEVPQNGGLIEQGPIGSGLGWPSSLALDGAGNLFIVSTGNRTIYKETPNPSGYSQSSVGSGILSPSSIAVDPAGNVYIADPTVPAIYLESPTNEGYIQTTLPIQSLKNPYGIAVDQSGNLYLGDHYDGTVTKETFAAGQYQASTIASGLGQNLSQISVDGRGNVFIADTNEDLIIRESPSSSGYSQTTLVDYANDGLRAPAGVTVDSEGNIYYSDVYTIFEKNLATPPNLAFTSTTDGVNTTSSSQTLTIENIGNSPLVLPVVPGGSNPSLANNFVFDTTGATTCPIVTQDSSASGMLPGGQSCQLLIDFAPTALGSYSGSVVITDNNLNGGTPGYIAQTVNLSGVQNSPTFQLMSSVGSGPVSSGSPLTSIITVTPESGFNVSPTLSVSGLPSGVTASFSSNPTSSSSTVTFVASASAATGWATVDISATFGNQTENVYIQLYVAPPPSFTLTLSPSSLSVAPGASATAQILITLENGYSGSVNLSLSGLPSGIVTNYSTNSTPSDMMLNITASGSAIPGTYPVTVTGSSGGVTQSAILTLIVQAKPAITWSSPSPIVSGTALSSTQLNATASVPGSFVYSPPAGTVLSPGPQTLNATFTPTDTTDYTTATASVQLTVDGPAVLTSPAPGSTLSGSSVTFGWTAGTGVSFYSLHLGTKGPGSADLYNSGNITTQNATVSNLPTGGQPVYARLYSWINGSWQTTDATYTAGGAAAPAAITSPAPGSTLAGASTTFTWNSGNNVSFYSLWVGTTGPGSHDLYNSGNTTALSATVSNLPTNAQPIYVRLFSWIAGGWQTRDFTYTAFGTPAPAVVTSPAPGSSLPGTTATFTWTAGIDVSFYSLWIGTTGPGSRDLYNSGNTTALSATVSNLPGNAQPVYVRLFSWINGAWQTRDFTYTAYGTPTPAVVTSPAPGSTLPGSTATFTWNTGTGVSFYSLWVGTNGVGSRDLYNSGNTTALSATVTTLPTAGQTIYVRLFSWINGAWQTRDFTYTAY